MRYLEKVFNFFGKHFLISLPLIIVTAIPAIIAGSVSNAELTQTINELSVSLANKDIDPFLAIDMILGVLRPILILSAIANIVSLVLNLFVMPATYGMINKGLETDNVSIADFFPQMTRNLPKFIVYLIFSFFVDIILWLIFFLIVALFVFISITLRGAGDTAFVLGIVLTAVIAVVLYVVMYGIKCILSYWFPAMVVDDMKVTSAFNKAIEVGRSYLFPTIGITFLISLVSSLIVGMLNNLASVLPYVGPILISIPAALGTFITLTFYLTVYRDKTRKEEIEDVINMPEEYI